MTQAPLIVKLYTVEQVAEVLGVTTACIRRWVLERQIAFVKDGRLVRIPGNELERVLEAGMRPALVRKEKPGGREKADG